MTGKNGDTIGGLLEQARRVCRLLLLSLRTEQTYIKYIRSFIAFHHRRHPSHLGGAEVTAYLTHLAVEGNVAASTQNVAFSALLFLYRNVLETKLLLDPDTVRAKRPRHIPVVFSRDEVKVLLSHIAPPHHLMALLLYGCGLRLTEFLQLRVKDIDFDYSQWCAMAKDKKIAASCCQNTPLWRCGLKLKWFAKSMRTTWRMVLATCICQKRWRANIEE